MKSDWVKAEAAEALAHRKLVPLRIETAVPSLRFRTLHTLDLTSWIGKAEPEPLDLLVESLCHYLGPPASQESEALPQPSEALEAIAAIRVAYERRDYGTALKLARPAAEQGIAVAQNCLGLLYLEGQGVPHDCREAMRWFHKAADQGNADGQFYTGLLYQNGYGVPQDYAEAMRWYRKSADQGNASAQNNIGTMYEYGQSVKQDDQEAIRWYRMAADNGHETAMGNFKRLSAKAKR